MSNSGVDNKCSPFKNKFHNQNLTVLCKIVLFPQQFCNYNALYCL